MFFLVEGYYRETKRTSYGKLVDTQAVAAPQLSGAIIRMMTRGGVNFCSRDQRGSVRYVLPGEEGKGRLTMEEVEWEDELPEYRLYVDSMGGEPVVRDIKGKAALEAAISTTRLQYPQDRIYAREVLETVVMVIAPDGTVTKLDEKRQ
jgi:hypothetical protein